MADAEKPIGYWLKHLHNLIEADFDATLGELCLTRRQWQILNLLSEAARSRNEIERELAPFWPDPAPELEANLTGPDGLLTRDWVADDQATLTLTDQGRVAHREALAHVAGTRRRLTRGLTAEQYVETVRILSVMAANVEAALAERGQGPGSG